MDSRTLILVNPASGSGGRRAMRRFLASDDLGDKGVEIFAGRSALDLEQAARRAAERGIGRVVACGGDGTIHSVLQGLVGSAAALGILPCGRGNDIARNLGIPRTLKDAWQVVQAGRLRSVDVGRVGNRFFLGVAGAGLDSQVNRCADARYRRLPGPLAYPVALARCLPGFLPSRVRLEFRGGAYDGPMMFLAAGNLAAYGGGMKIVPRASPDDGQFDVCLIKACSALRLLSAFPRVYWGRHLLPGLTEYWRTDWLHIDSDPPVELRADGEPVQDTPALLEILPRAIRVLV